ncbi:hypothetical protein M404DRAFT_992182 [Pisolithus tinctorius Marx 270]|uniref:Uncharacterized protein n=1 Tax=Pisolithus tinctorius Marx 270 TaxID=870435 RepID=A0A0C3PX12_PISTI|nr:hypothetical protein M404DRAFT_992182 [Pisolithus tinctorius Marx 270]
MAHLTREIFSPGPARAQAILRTECDDIETATGKDMARGKEQTITWQEWFCGTSAERKAYLECRGHREGPANSCRMSTPITTRHKHRMKI